MALQIENLKRTFKFKKDGKDITLEDPNPNMSTEEVQKFYAAKYPELTNATMSGPKVTGNGAGENEAGYTMKVNVGTKG